MEAERSDSFSWRGGVDKSEEHWKILDLDIQGLVSQWVGRESGAKASEVGCRGEKGRAGDGCSEMGGGGETRRQVHFRMRKSFNFLKLKVRKFGWKAG